MKRNRSYFGRMLALQTGATVNWLSIYHGLSLVFNYQGGLLSNHEYWEPEMPYMLVRLEVAYGRVGEFSEVMSHLKPILERNGWRLHGTLL